MSIAEEKPIEIDGSYGEGGGQILRTALALSAILKRPFTIHHIRSKRMNPGLQAQHLEAVEALAQITEAKTEGVKFGSQTISFCPKEIISGDYHFEVKTAGSVILLLQAIFLPLCLAQGPSRVTLVGGTHVPWSPPFHYFLRVLLPTLEPMGISVDAAIEKWGFYPRGGGRIQLNINPAQELKPLHLTDRGSLKRIWGLSARSNLPRHVAERQKDQAVQRIQKELNIEPEINVLHDVSSNGPGSFLFLLAEHEKAFAGFSSLGKKGKPAERVADEAVDDLKDYLRSGGGIDLYLSDQIIPFMALTKANSSFTTARMTGHLLTNLWVVSHFLQVRVEKQGEAGEPGRVDFIPPTY